MPVKLHPISIESDLEDFAHHSASIFALQNSATALINTEQTIIYANTALIELANKEHECVENEKISHLFPSLRKFEKIIQNCIDKNECNSLNRTFKEPAQHHLIPLKITISTINKQGSKSVLGALIIFEIDFNCFIKSVNKDKHLLAEKLQSMSLDVQIKNQLVKSLFDNSPIGMFILDSNRKIIKINKAGQDIFKITSVDAVGKHCDTFYTPEKNVNPAENNNHKPEITQIRGICATGEEIKLLYSAVISREKNQIFILESFVDISEIQKAKEAALSASNSKTEFLANMSHEMRTPMHSILSFAKLGMIRIETKDKNKLLNYFKRIYTSGNRLLLLLNDLLDLSKLEAGKLLLIYNQNELETLVNECMDEQKEALEKKQIHLLFIIDASSTVLLCDKLRINQVILNLLSNAICYSHQGGTIKLTISETTLKSASLEKKTSYEPALQFTIQDQGVGIPEYELEQIFDKFIQSSKTKTSAGGTGLGLAINQEIILQHHGKIWAEKGVEQGAIIKFVIPRIKPKI